ncbi:hypothetical protein AMECASPLE_028833 [Ameca splendens]|uniref:Uncharacterized protein n=1 Tax=Ameca splendens TaxID=208324 RepID=A0ABV0YGQ0_9TELE
MNFNLNSVIIFDLNHVFKEAAANSYDLLVQLHFCCVNLSPLHPAASPPSFTLSATRGMQILQLLKDNRGPIPVADPSSSINVESPVAASREGKLENMWGLSSIN